MRAKRICAEEEDFKAGLSKLKKDFQTRGYKESILEEHFAKVSNIDRKQLLTYNEKKGDNKIKFIIKYNRGLPNIRNVFESNCHILQTNEKLAETFEDKPILAFRRNRNLRDIFGGMRLENDSHARFPNFVSAENFPKISNAQHDKIQYTIERENEDKVLEFLYIKVINNGTGKYEFDIFRKKAITNVQVPESSHDPGILRGIFKGFLHRALSICSDKYIDKELDFLTYFC